MALVSGAHLNGQALLWGQIAITAIQLMTHYANEYFDLPADRANPTPTRWSGGSRVLVDGHLPPRLALVTALILALIALGAVAVLALIIQPAPLTFPLLLAALLLAWFYSAPPLKLHSRGLGEIMVAVLVPGLTPLTGFYLQTGAFPASFILSLLPLMIFQFIMILSIEFPDAAGDQASGKQTLVVRLGAARAARLYNIGLLLAYGLLPVSVLAGTPLVVAAFIGLTAPLGLIQGWRVWRGDWAYPDRWNGFAFGSVTLLMLASAVELAAYLWLWSGFR